MKKAPGRGTIIEKCGVKMNKSEYLNYPGPDATYRVKPYSIIRSRLEVLT